MACNEPGCLHVEHRLSELRGLPARAGELTQMYWSRSSTPYNERRDLGSTTCKVIAPTTCSNLSHGTGDGGFDNGEGCAGTSKKSSSGTKVDLAVMLCWPIPLVIAVGG